MAAESGTGAGQGTGLPTRRQYTRHGYQSQGPGSHALETALRLDGPFHPDYDDVMIRVKDDSIEFDDMPGFYQSTGIDTGSWLNSYDVYFQWKVTDNTIEQEWFSPEVHHHMETPFDGGKDVGVTHAAVGNLDWTVDLPDRPED
jgi:hypothetical protein